MLRKLLRGLAGGRDRDDASEAAERLIAQGRRMEDAGDLRAACAHYREAIAAAPRHPGAHLNLGVALEAAGDAAGALQAYEAVLQFDPANPHALFNAGKVHFVERAYPQAERYLRSAIEQNPAFPDSRVVLANLLDARGELREAAVLFESALALQPAYAGAWYNYATTLVKLDRFADAESALRRAVGVDPGLYAAHALLGDLLRTDGRMQEAIDSFRQARAHGGGIECEQAELHALTHFDGISDEDLFRRHQQVGAAIDALWPARFASFASQPDPDKRLRIGYVTSDFFRHPVSWFLIPVLERHDRPRFEISCYSTGTRADDVTEQVRALADRWVDASRMSHHELASAVHGDGIDILVDLRGHAGTSDLAVFAQQPAPVQVAWLGYLCTTGLARMHFRICDAATDPPAIAARFHTETLVRLPNSQWCYRPYRAAEFSSRHALEPPVLRNGFVTFGSFNHRLKLSPTVLALWSRILGATPDSRLVILGVPPGPARDRLAAHFAHAGVSASRLTMVPPLPLEDYFPWFDQVDLALDSIPYSGGTTTCDTLWMGVPVVTHAGSRSVSRSAASILAIVGLSDWIAATHEEYVDLAVRLARDRAALAGLRASIRRRMRESPLMDEPRFTRDLESAYRSMWRTWCAKGTAARVS